MLYVTETHERIEATRPVRARSSRSPASTTSTIGETLADPDDPRPLPIITVDEPSLSMTIGVNTSPLNGRDGKQAHRPLRSRPASTPS